jgi:hypothetical protein
VKGDGVDFIVFGDSHAMSLAYLMDLLGKEHGKSGMQLTGGAPSLVLGISEREMVSKEALEKRRAWQKGLLSLADSVKPKSVVVCGFWSTYQEELLRKQLKETISALLARNIEVHIVLDNPSISTRSPQRRELLATRWPVLRGLLPSTELVVKPDFVRVNREVEELAAELGVQVIDVGAEVSEWKSLTVNGRSLYYDSHHLSDYGALQLRPLFEPLFRE